MYLHRSIHIHVVVVKHIDKLTTTIS